MHLLFSNPFFRFLPFYLILRFYDALQFRFFMYHLERWSGNFICPGWGRWRFSLHELRRHARRVVLAEGGQVGCTWIGAINFSRRNGSINRRRVLLSFVFFLQQLAHLLLERRRSRRRCSPRRTCTRCRRRSRGPSSCPRTARACTRSRCTPARTGTCRPSTCRAPSSCAGTASASRSRRRPTPLIERLPH